MPREETLPETKSAPATQNLPEVIPKIAAEIARLDPGPAAALRRGPRNGAGAAAFWEAACQAQSGRRRAQRGRLGRADSGHCYPDSEGPRS